MLRIVRCYVTKFGTTDADVSSQALCMCVGVWGECVDWCTCQQCE